MVPESRLGTVSVLLLLLAVIHSSVWPVEGCGHDAVHEESIQYAKLHHDHHHSQGRSLQQTVSCAAPNPAPIRIFVEYQKLSSLSPEHQARLHDTVTATVKVLQKYIKVKRPVSGRLLAPALCDQRFVNSNNCFSFYPDFQNKNGGRKMCGNAEVNPNHIARYTSYTNPDQREEIFPGGTGEVADMYLYVTVGEDSRCSSNVVGWALSCLFEPTTGRPILANANFCHKEFTSDTMTVSKGVAVLIHEITHALGFTDGLYDKFIDDNCQPMTGRVLQNITNPYGQRVSHVVTPRVRQAVQEQFGCQSAAGAALENGGSDGSVNSHWEYSLFMGELMVSTEKFSSYAAPATMSKLTLALMEDTGWYVANYDAAGFLDWGYQAGCGFLQESCSDYISKNPKQPWFCNTEEVETVKAGGLVCSPDFKAQVATCDTSSSFGDGCPMKAAHRHLQTCLVPGADPYPQKERFGWTSGATSRCSPITFPMITRNTDGTTSQVGSDQAAKGAACYEMSCNDQDQLFITVLGQRVACPTGSIQNLAALPAFATVFSRGSIGVCPDNQHVCANLKCASSCYPGGECHNGKCYCHLDYDGPNCTQQLSSSSSSAATVKNQSVPSPSPKLPSLPTPAPSPSPALVTSISVQVQVLNTVEQITPLVSSFKIAVSRLCGVPVDRVVKVAYAATGQPSRTRRRLKSTGLILDSTIATTSNAAADSVVANLADPDKTASFTASMNQMGISYVNNSLAWTRNTGNLPTDGTGGNDLQAPEAKAPSKKGGFFDKSSNVSIVAGAVGGGVGLLVLYYMYKRMKGGDHDKSKKANTVTESRAVDTVPVVKDPTLKVLTPPPEVVKVELPLPSKSEESEHEKPSTPPHIKAWKGANKTARPVKSILKKPGLELTERLGQPTPPRSPSAPPALPSSRIGSHQDYGADPQRPERPCTAMSLRFAGHSSSSGHLSEFFRSSMGGLSHAGSSASSWRSSTIQAPYTYYPSPPTTAPYPLPSRSTSRASIHSAASHYAHSVVSHYGHPAEAELRPGTAYSMSSSYSKVPRMSHAGEACHEDDDHL